jgi:hypothetical protein
MDSVNYEHEHRLIQFDTNRVGIAGTQDFRVSRGAFRAVIPHAGQMHNYHVVMASLNSPMAEYFPSSTQGRQRTLLVHLSRRTQVKMAISNSTKAWRLGRRSTRVLHI